MRPRIIFITILLIATSAGRAAAQEFTLELDNDFVSAVHNRATLDVQYRVVQAQVNAHSPANDGEVHISGTAETGDGGRPLGFATVAEIMLAAQHEGPNGLLQWIADEGVAGRPVRMRGVWRLWGEHGETSIRQGVVPPVTTWSPRTNPPHIFELHPLTHLQRGNQTVSFLGDFRFLPGFTDLTNVSRTRGAFGFFERMSCRITPGPQRTLITGTKQQFNFVQFTAVLRGRAEPTPSGDGLFAQADIFDQRGGGINAAGTPLASDVRLVFVAGTPPAERVRTITAANNWVKLVGFARINLTPVNEAIRTGQTFTGKLPYEIVVASLGSEP
jgi:hypothetical protein